MSKPKEGKLKSPATIVLQFAANVEHRTLNHNGEVFIGTGITSSEASNDEDDEEETPKKKVSVPTPAPSATKSKKVVDEDEEDEDEKPVAKKKAKTKRPTEKEMMTMTADANAELWDMVDEIPGLRKKITSAEGKNTNAKIRVALLAAWDKIDSSPADDEEEEDDRPVVKKKKPVVEEEEEEEDERPKVKAGAASAHPKAAEKILRQLDSNEGGVTEKSAIKALVELGADKALATKLINDFSEDGTAPVETYIKKLSKIFIESEEDDEEEEEAPKSETKATKKRVAIEHDELEVDDEIIVTWDDGKDYAGTVTTINKKGIMVEYEDGDSDLLDDDMIVYKA